MLPFPQRKSLHIDSDHGYGSGFYINILNFKNPCVHLPDFWIKTLTIASLADAFSVHSLSVCSIRHTPI